MRDGRRAVRTAVGARVAPIVIVAHVNGVEGLTEQGVGGLEYAYCILCLYV